MFRSGRDTIIPEPTPERVYAICQYLRRHDAEKQELYHQLCMDDIFGDSSDIFNHTFNTAYELGLVEQEDNVCRASPALKQLKDTASFRRYTAHTALLRTDSLFFQISSLYYQRAEEMLACPGWADVVRLMSNYGLEIQHNAILGWRFWACFFGLGYLHENIVIPNCYQRIADALEVQVSFPRKTQVALSQFISWLEGACPEISASRNGAQLGLAVSNGLRTLQGIGQIELIRQPDAVQWYLYRFESDNEISHVVIVR